MPFPPVSSTRRTFAIGVSSGLLLILVVALWRRSFQGEGTAEKPLNSPPESVQGRLPMSGKGQMTTLVDKLPGGEDAFQGPFGICLGPDGDLYVADDLAHRILVFTRAGRLVRTLGRHGHRAGELAWLDAVAFDHAGLMYIADTGTNRIQVWQRDGTFLREFGRRRVSPPGRQLKNPRDVLIHDDLVYVADFDGDCIQVFNREGRSLKVIEGRGEGKLAGPIQLALSSRGTLFVSELHNHRIQAFDRAGQSLRVFGGHGSGTSELTSPHGLAFGPEGMLYIADHGNHRLQVCTEAGRFVGSIGGADSLSHPTDLCFDDDGVLYVVDKGHRRIVVVDVDELAN